MHLVVQAIVDGRDAAGDVVAPPREQQLDLRVREERILCRREALVLAETQRRDPMRIVRVALVRVIDEPAEVAAAAHGPDENGHEGVYATPTSDPCP